jgi:pimeloyl-ACP methyl ester carboxylesterase
MGGVHDDDWVRVTSVKGHGETVVWQMGTGRTAVVFFHGLLPAASGRIGAELAAALVDLRDTRVYAVDAPGFGESSAPPSVDGYSLPRLSERLATVVEGLVDAPVVLMGHSWGAAIASRVATQLRRRPLGLVLLDGGHFDHADLPEADPSETVADVRRQMVAMGWAIEGPTLDACVERVAGAGARTRPLVRAGVRAGLAESPAGLRSRVDLDHAAAAMHALMNSRTSVAYPILAQAGIPILLLLATQPDERAALNRERLVAFRRQVPDPHVVELPSTHDIPVHMPAAAARAVGQWLASLRA